MPGWPLWVQFLVFFVLSDFLQWSVHNLLHRVPFLWTFHKVHHAIHTMDFIGNFRFHWFEIVVYKTAQWLPLALLGASPQAVFWVAVFGTFWGDLNHANLNVGLGPLGYVFNNPRMHLWHHDASDEGGRGQELRDRALAVGLRLPHRLLAPGPEPGAARLPRRRDDARELRGRARLAPRAPPRLTPAGGVLH